MSKKKFQIMNSFAFVECWERIKSRTPIENYSQLAEIIGLSKSNVTKRKDENLFPIEWAFYVGQRYNLTTEWILTGKNQKNREDAIENREFQILNDLEEWVKEEVGRNPERKIWFEIQVLASFLEFKEWRRKRDEERNTPPGLLNKKVA